jgi:DNA-binding NarL/FixJ family response regulator
MPRILVTGDRPLIRTALSLLISSSETFTVVGECANDLEAISNAVAGRPDVVVMDLDLDPRCAANASPERLPQLIRAAKGCPILIVTAKEDPATITLALQHGVLGIVVKTRNAEVLLRAIRGVAAGEAWLEPAIIAHIVRREATHDTDCSVPLGRLTRRESEIVELVSFGLQNKKIAERLCISETTVRHHLTSIYDKLSVTNRLELMRHTYRGQVAVA